MSIVHSNDMLHFLSWLARQNPARTFPKIVNYMRYSMDKGTLQLRCRPPGIGVAVTERCNLKCVDCYWRVGQPGGTRLKSTDINPDDLKKVLDIFGRSALHCSLTGGEPLLHNNILSLIEMAAGRALYTTLFTNALLLDRFDESLLRSKLAALNMSPHSLEEQPELARSPHAPREDRVLSNIARLSSKRRGRRLRTSLSVIITRRTYQCMGDIIRLGERLGVDVVRLKPVILFNEPPPGGMPSWDDKELRRYFREEILPLKPSVDVVIPKFYEKDAPQHTCRELFMYLKFSVSGDVYPCCYLPLEQNYGNVFSESFDWNNAALREARAKMLEGNRLTAHCVFCPYVSTRNIQYNRVFRRWTGSLEFN
jgi:MoaA/NifB/PqqE/SkfB family radical SAM enzyme